jgi:MerR family transcriptional regulator, copper efflux regulator
MQILTIGEIARRTDVSADTIRYYERQGLIPDPARTDGGYRNYPPETIARLKFIRRAKRLGFSLREIQDLLSLSEDSAATASDIKQRAEAKLVEIEAQISDLRRMQTALSQLTRACPGSGVKERCPILHALTDGE